MNKNHYNHQLIHLLQKMEHSLPSSKAILSSSDLKAMLDDASSKPFVVSVVGAMKSGKSTFVNALLGHDLMPNENAACTLTTTDILHQPFDGKVYKYLANGRQMELTGENLAAIYHEDVKKSRESSNSENFTYHVNHEFVCLKGIHLEKSLPFVLTDTPGINEMETGGANKKHIERVFTQALERTDNLIYVIDFQYYNSEENELILALIKRLRPDLMPSIIFVLNKMDLVSGKDNGEEAVLSKVKRSLKAWGFDRNPVYPISSKLALLGRAVENGTLTPELETEIKRYLPMKEVEVEGQRYQVQLPPAKAYPEILKQSRIESFETESLVHYYQNAIQYQHTLRTKLLDNKVSKLAGHIQERLNELKEEKHQHTAQLQLAQTHKKTSERMEQAIHTTIERINQVLDAVQKEGTSFAGFTRMPAIPPLQPLSSGYDFGTSSSAKSEGERILSQWYTETARQLTTDIYKSYHDAAKNDKSSSANSVIQKVQIQLRTLAEQMDKLSDGLPLSIKPILSDITVFPKSISPSKTDELGISASHFYNKISTDSYSESFLIFFTNTYYSFSIHEAYQQLCKKMTEQMKQYNSRLKNELMKNKYTDFAADIGRTVKHAVSEALQQAAEFGRKQNSIITFLENKVNESEQRLTKLGRLYTLLRHIAGLTLSMCDPDTSRSTDQLNKQLKNAAPFTVIRLPSGESILHEAIAIEQSIVLMGAEDGSSVLRFTNSGQLSVKGQDACLSIANAAITAEVKQPIIAADGLYVSMMDCHAKLQRKKNIPPLIVVHEQHLQVEIRDCRFHGLKEVVDIRSSGKARVVNCIFVHNEIGLKISGGCEVEIQENSFIRNARGIELLGSSSGLVTKNHFIEQSFSGIVVAGESKAAVTWNEGKGNHYGVVVSGHADPDIQDNQWVESTLAGMYLMEYSMGRLKQNTCSDGNYGIRIEGEASSKLDGNVCRLNTTGVSISGKATVELRATRCESNHEAGISVDGHASPLLADNEALLNKIGIQVFGQATPEIRKCIFDLNNEMGLLLMDQSSSTVSISKFSGNPIGLLVSGNAQLLATRNTVTSASEAGLIWKGNSQGKLEQNTLERNFIDIHVSEQASPLLVSNSLANSKYGLIYDGNAAGTASGNTVTRMEYSGITVKEGATPLLIGNDCTHSRAGIELTGNQKVTLEGNTCTNHANYGIWLHKQARGILTGNHCKNNADTGIYVDEKATFTMQRNECSQNQYGIYIAGNCTGQLEQQTCENNIVAGIKSSTSGNVVGTTLSICNNPTGILLLNSTDISILKSQFENNEAGIKAEGHSVVQLKENQIQKNNVGIILQDVVQCVIQDSNVVMNRHAGILAQDQAKPKLLSNEWKNNEVGIIITGSVQATLENNICFQNKTQGMLLTGDSNSRLLSNKSHANQHGIEVAGKARTFMEFNDCTRNQYGIVGLQESSVELASSTITYNERGGIRVEGMGSMQLRQSSILHNGNGIEVSSSSTVEITSNHISDNSLHGVWMREGSCALAADNRIHKSGTDGVCVEANARPVIERNDISQNNRNGIQCKAQAGGKLYQNQCTLNKSFGLLIHPGAHAWNRGNKQKDNGIRRKNAAYWSNAWRQLSSHRSAKRLLKNPVERGISS